MYVILRTNNVLQAIMSDQCNQILSKDEFKMYQIHCHYQVFLKIFLFSLKDNV